MKTIILLIYCLVLLNGCVGPYYVSERQYDRGDWRGWADNQEVARNKSDRLAFEDYKKSSPTQNNTQKRRGFVYNNSRTRDVNIKIYGSYIRQKSFYLGPQEKVYWELFPGEYTAAIYDERGKIWGRPKTFSVGIQTHTVKVEGQEEEVPWYVISPRR